MNTSVILILAVALSFGVTALLGFLLIPWLKKLKLGQTILEIGPKWHKSKQGTPTMGGLMIALGVLISVLVIGVFLLINKMDLSAASSGVKSNDLVLILSALGLALGQMLIGFADDYIKVVKKQNKGLSPRQKSLGQLIVAAAFLLCLQLSNNTWMYVPFMGKVDLGQWLYGIPFWILGLIVICGASNAVNLTDGIDGLCTSVTLTVSIAFLVIAGIQKFTGLGLLAACLAGACAGFLVWNWHPAKVFMGDTGSLFLGGMVAGMAYACKCPFILIPIGIIYVMETMSDIIQIGYFKLTHGKRIFKMAPIHHHFEMSGWKEVKIVGVFTFISLIGCAIGVALMYYGVQY